MKIREERENPDGRAQTYPTYPGMLAAQAKITYTCRYIPSVFVLSFFSSSVKRKTCSSPSSTAVRQGRDRPARLPARRRPFSGKPSTRAARRAPAAAWAFAPKNMFARCVPASHLLPTQARRGGAWVRGAVRCECVRVMWLQQVSVCLSYY